MALWLSVALLAVSLCMMAWLLLRALVRWRQGLADSTQAAAPLPHTPRRPGRAPGTDRRWQALLARTLMQAGMAPKWTPQRWLALQGGAAIVAGLAVAASARLTDALPATLLLLAVVAAMLAVGAPLLWLTSRVRERQRLLLRDLPFFLDLLTLCVEAGQSLQNALQQAAQYGPPGLLRQELLHVLAQLRTGLARADAFDAMSVRSGLPALAQFALSLRQSDQFGISLGAVLRAQATRQRDARFIRAEKLALQAPVKMLFPLVCCIFPCTFLILGLPLLASFLHLLG